MRLTIILLALICAACGSAIPTIKPYKMDIQQGNVVTSKMMLQLRPGMSKSQVRFIMGTPLLVDSFHRNRWDYFYQMRKDGKVIDQRRVILDFEGDALKAVRGDVVPAGTDPNAVKDDIPLSTSYDKKPKTEEKSLTEKLKFWKKDEKPVEKAEPVPADLVKPNDTKTIDKPVVAPVPATSAVESVAVPEQSPAPKSLDKSQMVNEKPAAVAPGVQLQKDQALPAVKPAAVDTSQSTPPVESAPVKPVPEKKPVSAKAPAKPMVESKEPPVATHIEAKTVQSAPEKTKELPSEDSPGYFERMLEKIGF